MHYSPLNAVASPASASSTPPPPPSTLHQQYLQHQLMDSSSHLANADAYSSSQSSEMDELATYTNLSNTHHQQQQRTQGGHYTSTNADQMMSQQQSLNSMLPPQNGATSSTTTPSTTTTKVTNSVQNGQKRSNATATKSGMYNGNKSGAVAGGRPPATGGKKTKGRVKIKMEFIDNKLRRYTTFSKRKTGIMKKVR